MLLRLNCAVFHLHRHIENAGHFVIRKRRVGYLTILYDHPLRRGEAKLHNRGARYLGLDDARIDRFSHIADIDHFKDR